MVATSGLIAQFTPPRSARPPSLPHHDTLFLAIIYNFPFTHLESVVIGTGLVLSELKAVAVAQLLSLTTLCRVTIQYNVAGATIFSKIWSNFSPNIRHMERSCCNASEDDFHPIAVPIALESLRIHFLERAERWVTTNFVGLKTLSVGEMAEIRWPRFAPLVRSLEVPDVVRGEFRCSFDRLDSHYLICVGRSAYSRHSHSSRFFASRCALSRP